MSQSETPGSRFVAVLLGTNADEGTSQRFSQRPGWWREFWTALAGRAGAVNDSARSKPSAVELVESRMDLLGVRPKRRPSLLTLHGVMALVRRALVVAALLAGLLYAISPSMRGLVNEQLRAAKNWVESAISQKPVAVRPTSTGATAQLPDHPAERATDLATNTFWAAPDAAAKPKLVLGFDHQTRVVRAIVVNGGGQGDEFQALGRPHELHLVYFNGDTVTGTFDAALEDKPGKQEIEFGRGDNATRVEIQVMSVYPSPHSPGLALSEIELFERK
jgi:hypothetical protein